MKDPNNIDLQSVDPDLSVDQDLDNDGGATDLEDYAAGVQQWGQDTVEMTTTVASTVSNIRRRPTFPGEPVFHGTHQIKTPAIVAGIMIAAILLLVFLPIGD
jgi:hypothetical protein